jgi:hypothetical protein
VVEIYIQCVKVVDIQSIMKISGLSFSLKRAVGISGLKAKIAHKVGIPTTKQGLERKIGGAILKGVFGKKKSKL